MRSGCTACTEVMGLIDAIANQTNRRPQVLISDQVRWISLEMGLMSHERFAVVSKSMSLPRGCANARFEGWKEVCLMCQSLVQSCWVATLVSSPTDVFIEILLQVQDRSVLWPGKLVAKKMVRSKVRRWWGIESWRACIRWRHQAHAMPLKLQWNWLSDGVLAVPDDSVQGWSVCFTPVIPVAKNLWSFELRAMKKIPLKNHRKFDAFAWTYLCNHVGGGHENCSHTGRSSTGLAVDIEIYVCGVFVPNVFPCMSFLACAQRVYQSIKLHTCLPVGPFGFANLNVDHGFHPIARSLAHSVVWAGWSAQLFRRSTPDQGRDCGTALRRAGRGPIIDQRLRLSNHSDSPCPFGKRGGKMWKVAWKYHKS